MTTRPIAAAPSMNDLPKEMMVGRAASIAGRRVSFAHFATSLAIGRNWAPRVSVMSSKLFLSLVNWPSVELA